MRLRRSRWGRTKRVARRRERDGGEMQRVPTAEKTSERGPSRYGGRAGEIPIVHHAAVSRGGGGCELWKLGLGSSSTVMLPLPLHYNGIRQPGMASREPSRAGSFPPCRGEETREWTSSIALLQRREQKRTHRTKWTTSFPGLCRERNLVDAEQVERWRGGGEVACRPQRTQLTRRAGRGSAERSTAATEACQVAPGVPRPVTASQLRHQSRRWTSRENSYSASFCTVSRAAQIRAFATLLIAKSRLPLNCWRRDSFLTFPDRLVNILSPCGIALEPVVYPPYDTRGELVTAGARPARTKHRHHH